MLRRTALMGLLLVSIIGLVPVMRADDEITFEQAMALAQAQVPDGILIRGRVEGGLFGFYFWVRPRVIEVEINKSKDIVKKTKEDDKVSEDMLKLMESMTRGKTKLPDGRILEIATKKGGKTPVKALNYSLVDGKLMVQVNNTLIDAQTGVTTEVPPKK
jgi:hypothetical protein